MNRIGVAIVGINGAVASTLIAGVELMKRGLAPRIGMVTEKSDAHVPEAITELLEFAPLESLVFGGWDLQFANVYEGALHHRVFQPHILAGVRAELERVRPWQAISTSGYVENITGASRTATTSRRSPATSRPSSASRGSTGS
jgi:myo-inositol-1-phosphate synthase